MSDKKNTPISVFCVLKSLMDTKETKLTSDIDAANRATTEYPVLREHIIALRQVISNCRTFDPCERREAEADLEDKEEQMLGVQNRISRGERAKEDLKYVREFDKTYNIVCKMYVNAPRIHELKAIADEIEDRMFRLEDKIFSCEINMDYASRMPWYVAQAQQDALEYRRQYQDLESRLFQVRSQIKQLQK